MANFIGNKCPVCSERFTQSDDIVVCPDCGAPHHRACWSNEGHCANQDAHASGEVWRPETEPMNSDPFEKLKCTRCGTVNPAQGLFCEVCGTPLSGETKRDPQPSHNPNMPFPNAMPYNPFINPLAGLDAEEEIGGVTVKELAIYLGESTHYFLPQFKRMERGSKLTWNWAGFFFGYIYLAYRKLNVLAISLFALILFLSIPSLLLNMNDIVAQFNMVILSDAVVARLGNFYLITSFLTMVIRFLSGSFFNAIYKYFTIAKIKDIRQNFGETPKYHEELAKGGGVSRRGVLLILLLTFITSSIATAILVGNIF